jgi:hypothetical protein
MAIRISTNCASGILTAYPRGSDSTSAKFQAWVESEASKGPSSGCNRLRIIRKALLSASMRICTMSYQHGHAYHKVKARIHGISSRELACQSVILPATQSPTMRDETNLLLSLFSGLRASSKASGCWGRPVSTQGPLPTLRMPVSPFRCAHDVRSGRNDSMKGLDPHKRSSAVC